MRWSRSHVSVQLVPHRQTDTTNTVADVLTSKRTTTVIVRLSSSLISTTATTATATMEMGTQAIMVAIRATTVPTTTSAEDTAWAGFLVKVPSAEELGQLAARTEGVRILEADRTAGADANPLELVEARFLETNAYLSNSASCSLRRAAA